MASPPRLVCHVNGSATELGECLRCPCGAFMCTRITAFSDPTNDARRLAHRLAGATLHRVPQQYVAGRLTKHIRCGLKPPIPASHLLKND